MENKPRTMRSFKKHYKNIKLNNNLPSHGGIENAGKWIRIKSKDNLYKTTGNNRNKINIEKKILIQNENIKKTKKLRRTEDFMEIKRKGLDLPEIKLTHATYNHIKIGLNEIGSKKEEIDSYEKGLFSYKEKIVKNRKEIAKIEKAIAKIEKNKPSEVVSQKTSLEGKMEEVDEPTDRDFEKEPQQMEEDRNNASEEKQLENLEEVPGEKSLKEKRQQLVNLYKEIINKIEEHEFSKKIYSMGYLSGEKRSLLAEKSLLDSFRKELHKEVEQEIKNNDHNIPFDEKNEYEFSIKNKKLRDCLESTETKKWTDKIGALNREIQNLKTGPEKGGKSLSGPEPSQKEANPDPSIVLIKKGQEIIVKHVG